jgi:hypothetical protein
VGGVNRKHVTNFIPADDVALGVAPIPRESSKHHLSACIRELARRFARFVETAAASSPLGMKRLWPATMEWRESGILSSGVPRKTRVHLHRGLGNISSLES